MKIRVLQSLSTARILLSPSCSIIRLMPALIAKRDLLRMVVMSWCVHPDLIPRKNVLVIPEPCGVHVGGPPMFTDLEDVNYPSQSTLRYRVFIDIIDVADWETPHVQP
jgi:hypothetical protein